MLIMLGKPRHNDWPKVRKDFLKKNKMCSGCGDSIKLEVHHIKPYHLFPELELVESNLITLCEAHMCHFILGHGMNWQYFNLNVIKDAARLLKKLKSIENFSKKYLEK